jgi:hypothetical protein
MFAAEVVYVVEAPFTTEILCIVKVVFGSRFPSDRDCFQIEIAFGSRFPPGRDCLRIKILFGPGLPSRYLRNLLPGRDYLQNITVLSASTSVFVPILEEIVELEGVKDFMGWRHWDPSDSKHGNYYIRVEQQKLDGELLFSLPSKRMVMLQLEGSSGYSYQCPRLVWNPGVSMMNCLRTSNLWAARICNVPIFNIIIIINLGPKINNICILGSG